MKNKLLLFLTLVLLILILILSNTIFKNYFSNVYLNNGAGINTLYLSTTQASVPVTISFKTVSTLPFGWASIYKYPLFYLFDVNKITGDGDLTNATTVNNLFNISTGKYYNAFNKPSRTNLLKVRNITNNTINRIPLTINALPINPSQLYPNNIINFSIIETNTYDGSTVYYFRDIITSISPAANAGNTLSLNTQYSITINPIFPIYNEYMKSNNNYILGIALQNSTNTDYNIQPLIRAYSSFYYIPFKFSATTSVPALGNEGNYVNVPPAISGYPALSAPFISTWKTTTVNELVTLPTISYTNIGANYTNGILKSVNDLLYNCFIIDWGDGIKESYVEEIPGIYDKYHTDINKFLNSPPTHIYAFQGDHVITIIGQLYGFSFNRVPHSKDKLISIQKFGCLRFVDTNARNPTLAVFYRAYNFTGFGPDIDIPDLTLVTSLQSYFNSARLFDSNVNNWDVSNITDMAYMFHTEARFTVFNNGGVPLTWGQKTANVTNMNAMFNRAGLFNQDISDWNVSNVTDMNAMFQNTLNFDQDISSWNVSKVINMRYMFRYSNKFNKNINNWNVGQVTDFYMMFWGCNTLSSENRTLIKSGWETMYNVINIRNWYYSYINNESFKSTWKTSVTNEVITFPTISYKNILANYKNDVLVEDDDLLYNYFTIHWGDQQSEEVYIENIPSIIRGLGNIGTFKFLNSPPTHTYANPGNYIITISGQLYGFSFMLVPNSKNNLISIEKFGTFRFVDSYGINPGNPTMAPFYNTNKFTGFGPDIDIPDLTFITSLQSYFNSARLFNSNVNNWDVSNVTDMTYMFNNEPGDVLFAFNNGGVPLTWGEKTANVYNMEHMFKNCYNFNQDISNWNVGKVTRFYYMFANCNLLSKNNRNLIQSRWESQGVTYNNSWYMSYIFNNFSSVWNTNISKTITLPFYKYNLLKVNYDNGVLITDTSLVKYNRFIINWGDGSIENLVDSDFTSYYQYSKPITYPLTHTYNESNKEYTISIQGYIYGFSTNLVPTSSKGSLIKINNWGCLKLADTNNPANPASVPFLNCTNFTGFGADIDIPDLSLVKSLQSFFNGCNNFNGNVANWNTSNVIDMSYMFWEARAFNQNLSAWNVTNVNIFTNMFYRANSLTAENKTNIRIAWESQGANSKTGWPGGL